MRAAGLWGAVLLIDGLWIAGVIYSAHLAGFPSASDAWWAIFEREAAPFGVAAWILGRGAIELAFRSERRAALLVALLSAAAGVLGHSWAVSSARWLGGVGESLDRGWQLLSVPPPLVDWTWAVTFLAFSTTLRWVSRSR